MPRPSCWPPRSPPGSRKPEDPGCRRVPSWNPAGNISYQLDRCYMLCRVTTTGIDIDYLRVARQVAGRPDDWPLAPRFDPAGRWYHRLSEGDGFEVWLLTWLPGQ